MRRYGNPGGVMIPDSNRYSAHGAIMGWLCGLSAFKSGAYTAAMDKGGPAKQSGRTDGTGRRRRGRLSAGE
jgi:hypothetical protein